MRIVKEAEIRKNEIMEAAANLFAEKGFDHTSITDILNAVGIAKGTLYYHFKSKEEIMDALIQQQSAQILSAAQKVAEDKSIPVEERMIRTILSLRVENTEMPEGKEMIEHLHRPQNALMQQKSKQIIFKRVPPMLAGIIQDGIEQGSFTTPYPLECMEMALYFLDITLDDDLLELTDEQRKGKIKAFIFCLERLLGVETGELYFFAKVFVDGDVYE